MIRTTRYATARQAGLAALALLTAACTRPAPEAGISGPELADYVAAPDPTYEWRELARYERGSTEVVELRLHSQTWRGTLFKHRLFMIRPAEIATGGNALLIIGGGRWEEADETAEPPESLPDDAGDFIAMAEAMETVVAVLGTVPFQPLDGLTEDELIAHTFDAYLRDPDPERPLLLPMVKSAARAMDAVQAAADEIWALAVEGFTVTGGSKRGWTAWLTAAVDERVAAIAPIVFDALNMAEHFPHQSAVWGSPSEMVRPYTALDLPEALSSSEGERLRRIVDPYAYRAQLTMPKLIVNATNDAYFPVDSANLYWDGLDDPKYLVYAANQPHSIGDLELVVPSINAVHRAVSGDAPLPELAWEYASRDGGLALCIRADPAPANVTWWHADSADRDFRDARWRPARLEPEGSTHVIELPRPESGYRAVYADLTFAHGAAPYYLSTAIAVMSAAEPGRLEPRAPGREGTCASARGAEPGRD